MTVAMSAQDALWLTMDRPNNLMVIDSLMLIEGPLTVGQVRVTMTQAVDRFPVFSRRALRRGRSWRWENDPDFDVSRHVSRVRGGPRDIEALQRWIGEQRAVPLDPERPMWQVHLISPVRLSDGTTGSAVITRFHHSLADGVRATQVMLGLCEADSVPVPLVGRQGVSGDSGNPLASAVSGTVELLRVMASLTMQAVARIPTLRGITDAVRAGVEGAEHGVTIIRHPDRLLDALEVLGAEEHRSLNDAAAVTKLLLTGSEQASWSGQPGTRKVVAWSPPIPLSDVKAVGQKHGATVNDVLLAAIAGAMRTYLADRGESIGEVVWMVPVNLTPFSPDLPDELGNHFALVMLPMPLHHDEWSERLAAMRHRMGRIKHSDEAVLTFGVQHAVSVAPQVLARAMTNFFANKAIGVLTNVPGPTQRLTFSGQPLRQFIGFAPCSGDQTMTATIVSYDGNVTVGFATDFSLVPQPDELVEGVLAQVALMSNA